MRDFLRAAEPLRRLVPSVMPLKNSKAAMTLAQAQNPAPHMFDHASDLEHHLMHRCPDATRVWMTSNFCYVTNRRFIGNSSQADVACARRRWLCPKGGFGMLTS